MKTLRSKFTAIFFVLTLLPVLPLAYLAQSFLKRTLSIALQKPMAEGLSSAVELVSAQMNAEARKLAFRLNWVKSLNQKSTQAKWDWGLQNPLSAINPEDSVFLAVADTDGIIFKNWPEATALDFNRSLLKARLQSDSLINLGIDSAAVRLALRLPAAMQPAAWLIGVRSIPSSMAQRLRNIVNAAQMRQALDLQEAELRQEVLVAFLASYAPMLLLSLVAGWYFALRITAPLDELAVGVKKLAAGQWEHRVVIRAKDEIGQVGTAFNQMVGDLKRQQEQMLALEKMAAWREIARVLAHEIKNPLTPMQLMVRQIQDEYNGQDETYRRTLSECCKIIDEEIEKLRQLVREFSDFARMPELHPALGSLNELALEVSRLYAQRPVELELDPALPKFNFDWEAMRRVLINLLENARQASSTAKITMRTAQLPPENQIAIAVEDTGPGIPPENLSRIFEPYFSTKKSGVGLGLAIVKRIIEEHGGIITVSSEAGCGSSFVCKFSLNINRKT
jgi:nitrogen fixation/metabolism regulation signal transduction histidine kinase